MLIGIAYILGTQAAGLSGEWRAGHNAAEYRSKAVKQTAAILRKMGTIKVGDTLSNFAFEDIDGELHLLNEILTDRTLITYMRPDCDGCLVELERLSNAASSPEDYERVLIISSANPLHLQRLREDYGLGCLMLYDEERLFGAALQIYTFPFNLVVNRDRVILEIHGNVLLQDDYERLFSVVVGVTWPTMSEPQGFRPTMLTRERRSGPLEARRLFGRVGVRPRVGLTYDPMGAWHTSHPERRAHSHPEPSPISHPEPVEGISPFVIPAKAAVSPLGEIHDRRVSQRVQAFALGRMTHSRSCLRNALPPQTKSEWSWTPASAGVTWKRGGAIWPAVAMSATSV